ncbi:hypothetical protein CM19_06815 [Candidatus Acidianus copahuensis]|uniref:Uncharacterized protein n=2 Tax=Sulfolobaceae TaxID=118883 RepID=A0A031LPV4_9CREN|nr:hypothetical protein CM19_06815 [Candidatus Acidianus copahuensis]
MNCEEVFNKVLQVVRSDEISLSKMLEEIRVNEFNEMKRNREEYEKYCLGKDFHDNSVMLGYFDLALLKLAFSIDNPGIKSQFTRDEIEAFQKLDRFIRLDYVTDKEIVSALLNKKGQIYDVIKTWYYMQMYEYEKLIDPLSYNVRETLASALRQEYRRRMEKIKLGIRNYMDIDPGSTRRLFEEYESAILSRAELERQRAEDLLNENLEEGGSDQIVISMLERRISQLREERDKLQAEVEELKKKIENVDENTKVVLKGEIENLQRTNQELRKKVQEYEVNLSKLKSENEELRLRVEKAENPSERYVRFDEARIMEVNFLGRFEMKMNSLPRKFYDPIRRGEFLVKELKEYYVYRYDQKGLLSQLGIKDIAVYPHNSEILFVAKKNRIFGEPLEIVVKGIFLSHIESFIKSSFDNNPVSLADLLNVLDRAIESGRLGKVHYVVGIGSPTGFDERVKRYVTSQEFKESFVNFYVTLILVDLESGEVYYNKGDKLVDQYLELFEPDIESEKIEKIINYLKEKIALEKALSLERVIEETGYSKLVVKRAFLEAEKEGIGKVKRIKDKLFVVSE